MEHITGKRRQPGTLPPGLRLSGNAEARIGLPQAAGLELGDFRHQPGQFHVALGGAGRTREILLQPDEPGSGAQPADPRLLGEQQAACLPSGMERTIEAAAGLAGQLAGFGVQAVDFGGGGSNQAHGVRPVVTRKFAAS